MDQNHCRIPHLGTQNAFSNPLKQCITGIKEHGQKVTIYRTINTVSKGADLTIYCILRQLDSWRQRYQCYPEEIYLQVDGGCENANQYVLSLLELLVVKRVCRLVYYSRLPVGHTHEDIDACFAVIWRIFRHTTCSTLDEYKRKIETSFKSEQLSAFVEDVWVVPNYQGFLENCIDTKLSRLHKEIQTQLQWRFEAVSPSRYFPLGCKTNYRAYSSDKVVEFLQKPEQQCMSDIGKLTGLEPCTLYIKWYPSATCHPDRPGIEGMYLLKALPHHNFVTNPMFEPVDLPDKVHEEISATLSEVRKHFNSVNSSGIRETWRTWGEKFAPDSSDVKEYIAKLSRNRIVAYSLPLKAVLYDSSFILKKNVKGWKDAPTVARSNLNDGIVWPEDLAAATNSVLSEINPKPPAARLYLLSNADLLAFLEEFRSKTTIYYQKEPGGELIGKNANQLKKILSVKVQLNGEAVSIPGKLNKVC